VLAGGQALHGLRGVHLCWRTQDGGLDAGLAQGVHEVGGGVGDAETRGDFARGVDLAADQRGDFDAVDLLQRFEVLDAEGAGAGEDEFHGFSKRMWPTAVFDAGTW